MGEARRRKLAGNTEPKKKRNKKIPKRIKMVETDPTMALVQTLALLMQRRR